MKAVHPAISRYRKLILLLVLIPLMGRAQRLKYGQPFPAGDAFQVSVIHDDRPSSRLPAGAYRVPNSSYHFYSAKKGTQFFGAVGALIEAGSKGSLKKNASKEEIFRSVNLDTLVVRLLKERIQPQAGYSFTAETGQKDMLRLRPCCWIFIEGSNYEMAFEIETNFFNKEGTEIWKGQYTYVVPDAKPLAGAGSLVDDDGQFLNQLAQRALARCIDALLEDVKGTGAPWKSDKIPAELNEFPKGCLFLKLPKDCVLLQDTPEDWIIKQPVLYQGSVFKIISKNKDRLLPHPVRKPE